MLCNFISTLDYLTQQHLPTSNMAPMKPKRHHDLHLRPTHLLKAPRIQTAEITPPLVPVQHHAQTHPVVFFFPLRIANEYRLPRALRVVDARDGGLGPGVEFEEAVEEGGVAAVADAVDVAGRFRGVGWVEGGEFGRIGAGGGE